MILSLTAANEIHLYFCTNARIYAVIGVTRRGAEKVEEHPVKQTRTHGPADSETP